MRTKTILAAVILAVFAGSHLAKAWLAAGWDDHSESHRVGAQGVGRWDSLRSSTKPSRPTKSAPTRSSHSTRIVSTAPSLTETLFALGLGDRVVGVTDFCNYPAEARKRPKIGAVLNPSFEAIVALRPDLVVTLSGEEQNLRDLHKLGLRTLVVCHQNIEGILQSFKTIGGACGAEARAEAIRADIQARLDRVQRKLAGRPRARALFAVERTLGTGRLEDVYITGRDGHLDRIVELAGGRNAYQGDVRFPVVSREGMIRMNPQMILDLVPGLAGRPVDRRAVMADWQGLAEVEAVHRGQVYLIEDDYAFIPGPRFILLVEKLARLIHPEVDWRE